MARTYQVGESEYNRFKEYLQEKRTYSQRVEELERETAKLRESIERLKSHNTQLYEMIYTVHSQLEEML